MKSNQGFIDFIVDTLSPIGEITVGRMFGGKLLKCRGKQLGAIWGDVLWFRIPESLQAKYAEHGSKPFEYTKKDKMVIVKAYWSTPEDLLDDPHELVAWAEEVLRLSKDLPPRKKL